MSGSSESHISDNNRNDNIWHRGLGLPLLLLRPLWLLRRESLTMKHVKSIHRTRQNDEHLKAILLVGCSNHTASIDDILKVKLQFHKCHQLLCCLLFMRFNYGCTRCDTTIALHHKLFLTVGKIKILCSSFCVHSVYYMEQNIYRPMLGILSVISGPLWKKFGDPWIKMRSFKSLKERKHVSGDWWETDEWRVGLVRRMGGGGV